MAHRGRFATSYEAATTQRFLENEEAVTVLNEQVCDALATIDTVVSSIAATLTEEHNLDGDVARLLVAQRLSEATDFLRWVKAGEARAAGIPVRGLMDAMGFAAPTSISRRVTEIDYVAAVRAHVDASGAPDMVADDRGYRITLTPRQDGVDTVSEARRRRIIAD